MTTICYKQSTYAAAPNLPVIDFDDLPSTISLQRLITLPAIAQNATAPVCTIAKGYNVRFVKGEIFLVGGAGGVPANAIYPVGDANTATYAFNYDAATRQVTCSMGSTQVALGAGASALLTIILN